MSTGREQTVREKQKFESEIKLQKSPIQIDQLAKTYFPFLSLVLHVSNFFFCLHSAANYHLINHDLLPSGPVAQLLEQGEKFLILPRAILIL